MIHCLSGGGSGRTGSAAFRLHAGQVAILPAGEPHHYEADELDPWTISWMHFQGSQALEYLKTIEFHPGSPGMDISIPETLREQFEILYGLTQGAYSDPTLFALHTKLADYFSTLLQGRRASVPKQRERMARIHSVIRFLRQNVHRPVSVEEMAAQAHWTPNHFSNIFRGEVNETPASFFLHLKMTHASMQLRQTDLPIAEIAESLGFDDAFYFSRCFRRVFRMSPPSISDPAIVRPLERRRRSAAGEGVPPCRLPCLPIRRFLLSLRRSLPCRLIAYFIVISPPQPPCSIFSDFRNGFSFTISLRTCQLFSY